MALCCMTCMLTIRCAVVVALKKSTRTVSFDVGDWADFRPFLKPWRLLFLKDACSSRAGFLKPGRLVSDFSIRAALLSASVHWKASRDARKV